MILNTISKSIIGEARVDLTELKCFYGRTPGFSVSSSIDSTDFKVTDEGEITMVNTIGDNTQAYISYELNPLSKYRLILKFNNHPS